MKLYEEVDREFRILVAALIQAGALPTLAGHHHLLIIAREQLEFTRKVMRGMEFILQ